MNSYPRLPSVVGKVEDELEDDCVVVEARCKGSTVIVSNDILKGLLALTLCSVEDDDEGLWVVVVRVRVRSGRTVGLVGWGLPSVELEGWGLSEELCAKATATRAARTKKKIVSFIVAVSNQTDAQPIDHWPFYSRLIENDRGQINYTCCKN